MALTDDQLVRKDLLDRAAILMSRLGLDPTETMATKAGPFAGHLLLVPLLEKIVDRLEALEKTPTV